MDHREIPDLRPATFESLPVEGYRPQTSTSIDLVNQNKREEERILRRLDLLAETKMVDPRWLAIGRTHLELAWMAINRAIFKPERVKLPDSAVLSEDFKDGFDKGRLEGIVEEAARHRRP